MSRRVGDMRQIEKYLLGHDRKEKERLFSNKMEAIVRYETFSWQKRYVRLTWPRKQGPYSERCGLIYRAVLKKCPGERHIVEPRGFFYLKEQIF